MIWILVGKLTLVNYKSIMKNMEIIAIKNLFKLKVVRIHRFLHLAKDQSLIKLSKKLKSIRKSIIIVIRFPILISHSFLTGGISMDTILLGQFEIKDHVDLAIHLHLFSQWNQD